MKRYEYFSFIGRHDDAANEYLDELGKSGWEAFAVVPNGDRTVFYLKREIQQ